MTGIIILAHYHQERGPTLVGCLLQPLINTITAWRSN